MSKPATETRNFKPAKCTRAGLTDRARVVYHPRRGNHPAKALAPEGEAVEVRPSEVNHWARLLRFGDVVELKNAPKSKPKASSAKE